jgi:hypothetical protein
MPHAAANMTDIAGQLVDILDPAWISQYVDPTGPSSVLDQLGAMADLRLDLLLFYYTGHGLRDIDDRLCLALPGSVDNAHDARRTSLPADAVFEILRRSVATHRVVILDCCYSGLAFDEAAAADLHLLTATGRTDRALFDETERNTAFTGEMLRIMNEGVADGPQWLNLDLVFRRLEVLLGARDLPVPQQRAVNLSGDIVLGRNPRAGTARSTQGLRSRAYFADQVGRAGRPAQAVKLFAGLVADAPEVPAYQRAYARWIGEDGDPAGAVSVLKELVDSLPPGPDRYWARVSLEHWTALANKRSGE